MARDISRSLNDMRRKADYNVADRIVVEWSSDAEEAQTAMRDFEEFIKREALAIEIRRVDKPSGDQTMRLELEGGLIIHLAVRRSE